MWCIRFQKRERQGQSSLSGYSEYGQQHKKIQSTNVELYKTQRGKSYPGQSLKNKTSI